MVNVIQIKEIEQKIYFVRGRKVMLDKDLATLYQVETKALKRAVKRNMQRFPDDFMFELTKKELDSLRYQIGTSNDNRGGDRYAPYVFSQEGVAMLSGVLNSEAAIQANIAIMRAFVRMRELALSDKELYAKLRELENKYDKQFKQVFDAIYALMKPEDDSQKSQIGFEVV